MNKMMVAWASICLLIICTAIPVPKKGRYVASDKNQLDIPAAESDRETSREDVKFNTKGRSKRVLDDVTPSSPQEDAYWSDSKQDVFEPVPKLIFNSTTIARINQMNNASRQLMSTMKHLYINYEQAKEVLHHNNIAGNLREYLIEHKPMLKEKQQKGKVDKSGFYSDLWEENDPLSPQKKFNHVNYKNGRRDPKTWKTGVNTDLSLLVNTQTPNANSDRNTGVIETDVSVISDNKQSSMTLYAKELFLGPMTSCQHVTGYYEPRWLRMVVYCPAHWSNNTVRAQCEAGHAHSVDSYVYELTSLPVQDHRGTVYANIYCAQCHEVSAILPWSTNVVCSQENPDVLFHLSMLSNMAHLYSFLQTPHCKRKVIPAIPSAIRECQDHAFHLSWYTRKESAVVTNANDYPVSFNVLMNFDFSGDTHLLFSAGRQIVQEEVTPRCREWETYDTYMMKCRPITCSRHYELSGNTCVKVGNTSSNTDSITDLSQLRSVDQTAMVSLLVNITYGDFLIIKFQDTETDIVPQIAEHLNITMDRITNLNITYEFGSINGTAFQVTTLTAEQYASLFPPLDEGNNQTMTTPGSWEHSATGVAGGGIVSGSVKGSSKLLEVKMKKMDRHGNDSAKGDTDTGKDDDVWKFPGTETEEGKVKKENQMSPIRIKRETTHVDKGSDAGAEIELNVSDKYKYLSTWLETFETTTQPFQSSEWTDGAEEKPKNGNSDTDLVARPREGRNAKTNSYAPSNLDVIDVNALRPMFNITASSDDKKYKRENKKQKDGSPVIVTKYNTFALYHFRSQDIVTDFYISTPVNSRNERILLETQKEDNIKMILGQRMVMKISFVLVPPHDPHSNQEAAQTLLQKIYKLILEEQFSLKLNGNQVDVVAAKNGTHSEKPLEAKEFCPWGVEYTVLDDEFIMMNVDNVTLMYVNKTNSYIGVGRFDLFVIVSGSNTPQQTNVTDMLQYAFVCFMPRISQIGCNRIDLTAKEYYVAGPNRSIIFEEKEYDIFSYRVLNEATGAIQICVPQTFSDDHQTILPKVITIGSGCGSDFNDALEAEGYMTFVLGRISIGALVWVLFTYLLFPKLRNLPGISTMNLTFSLLVTQIIFSEGIVEDTKWLCSAVAVSLHYTLLVAHFWMNVMSYDVYRTFSRPTLLTHIREKKKYLPRYALYAWGIPAVIVALCVFVDFSGWFASVSIGYGGSLESPDLNFNMSLLNFTESRNDSLKLHPGGSSTTSMCWITKPLATLVAFGAPILIIFLANCIFFAKTIMSISNTAKLAKRSLVTRHSSSSFHKMTGRSDVMLYLRMSTVMGFTWIFGLSSAILSSFAKPVTYSACIVIHVVGILFILFNTSQGIFIFGAFVCNRRVFGLYAALLHKLKRFVLRQAPPSSLYTISSTLADSRNTVSSHTGSQGQSVNPAPTPTPSAVP